MKKPLVVISGPTACGKTDISIGLAKKIDGEIISADSMQAYKYMDIGTAKVTVEEMQGVKHYLIDEIYPDEQFSISLFQNKAKKYIEEIYLKNKIPILTGGTGFYINSILYNNEFTPEENDSSIRNTLYYEAEKYGPLYVYDKLKSIDLEASKKIHPNNVKRVVRAIEYYMLTGEKISEHNKREKLRETHYNAANIILTMDRAVLYERINRRVDIMIENGLVEEVKRLIAMGYSPESTSMQGIGYKELVPYIKGEIPLYDAIEQIKKNTRHYAKRQLTWFKGQSEGHWIDVTNIDKRTVLEYIYDYLVQLNIAGECDGTFE